MLFNNLISQENTKPKVFSKPNIVVMPKAYDGKNPIDVIKSDRIAEQIIQSIKNALQKEGFTPKDAVKDIQNFDLQRAKMKSLNLDNSALIASCVDADIFFEFTYSKNDKFKFGARQYICNLDVIESGTNQSLGTVTGTSGQPSNEGADEMIASIAAENALKECLTLVTSYWNKTPTMGKPYNIIIGFNTIAPNEDFNGKYPDAVIQDYIMGTMKAIGTPDPNVGDKTIIYKPVYFDINDYPTSSKVRDSLRKLFDNLFPKESGIKMNVTNTGKIITIDQK
jgi:hypothetical protein